jgi:hypothetical protein
MTILRKCELWWIKCDPKKPNPTFDKENPRWEVQIRTTDKSQMQDWKAVNLKPKSVTDEDGNHLYWKINLQKKSKKSDNETPLAPVKFVDGGLNDIDPNTVGNGSVGDVRLFQYDYETGTGKNKKKGIASMLMAVQVTKHIVYTPPQREDDFEMQDTEVIEHQDSLGEGEEENTDQENDEDPPY